MTQEELQHVPTSTLSLDDIGELLDAGHCRRVPEDFVLALVRQFTVYEETKHRRRVINWPQTSNDDVDYSCEIELTNLEYQLKRLARPGRWATTVDLAMSFNMLALSEDVQRFFCFKASDGFFYANTRMVMGFRPAAEVMNKITWVLAHYARTEQSETIVHIDNVGFFATEAAPTAAAMASFKENARLANAMVNEEETNSPHRRGIFLGVFYDYEIGTARLSPKTLRKLQTIAHEVQKYDNFFSGKEKYNSTLTVGRMFEIMGVLYFAAAVLRTSPGGYYAATKQYRRVAAKFEKGYVNLTSTISLWVSARASLLRWVRFLLANEPARHNLGLPRYALYTDASKTGWGAVLFSTDKAGFIEYGTRIVVRGEWLHRESTRHISELEAEAIVRALQRFAPMLDGCAFTLHVDNTSVLGALRKAQSPKYWLNKRVVMALDLVPNSVFDVRYVATRDNFADGPSRGRQLTVPRRDYGWYGSLL